MKLITQKILQELQEADIYAGYNMDSPVIVKYFNPYGVGTWLVVGICTVIIILEAGNGGLFAYLS